MSISSKSRRDARRRRTPQGASARSDAPQIHAQLKGPDDRVLAGATYADGEWTFVLRGEPVTSTASAAMLLAMLRHVAASRHAQGIATRLSVSKALDAAANAEAAAEGRTLTEHLDWLEAERRTRNDPPAPAPVTH
ncbi:hypothetical protein CMZ84_04760 [Lysobacteraceae bacterium NML93-0399]|nr:hypothetical protein CMZ84_04760 [Xanthomonadaceae bacterium NML93-0399]